MRKKLLVNLAILVALATLALPSFGQTTLKPDLGASKTSLDVDKVEARAVIRILLKGVKASFVIDGDVQGTVTANLEDVTVERALMEVLRQVGAGYRYEDGIYRIVKLKNEPRIDPKTSSTLTLDLDGADIKVALRSICRMCGISYSVEPDVEGKVELSVKNVSFESVLQMILKQVDATYRVENGVYMIVKRKS